MYLRLLLLCFCLAYTAAETVSSSQCTDKLVNSNDVLMEVSGCTAQDENCPLIKGTEHTVTLHFTPSANFTDYTQCKVFGMFKDFSVPYGRTTNACLNAVVQSNEEDTCDSLGGFFETVRYTHVSKFSVSRRYPSLKLKVRFLMLDRRSKNVLLCQEVPVEIMDPPATE